MNYPVLKETTQIRIFPHGCWACEEMSDSTITFSPQVGCVLSLCNGYADLNLIKKCVSTIYKMSEKESEELVIHVLNTCKQFIQWKEKPSKRDMPYELEDFLYNPKPLKPLERFTYPVESVLSLTNQCNFQCVYCYNSSGGKHERKELTVSQWVEVAKQLVDIGVVKFTLTGGEPFLFSGFWNVYEILKKNNSVISICSNGSLIDDMNLKRLVNSGQRTIQISLDTANSQQNDKITLCKGIFPTVVNNIEQLVKAGLQVTVKAVMIPQTIDGVFDLIKLCSDLGVYSLVLDSFDMCYCGRGNEKFFLDLETSTALENHIAEESKKYSDHMRINFISPKKSWESEEDIFMCGAFFCNINMMPNGEYTLCEKTCGNPQWCIGYFPEMSVKDLWTSNRINQLMNPPHKKIDEPCRSCEYLNKCHTGCYAAKQFVTQSPYAPDPRCFKANYPNNPFKRINK